jgi:S1-C subfamily serine protease
LRVATVRENDGETAGQVAALLDPWVKRKFRDPDRGAKLHLLAARMLQSTRRFDEATKQMQYAVDYRPLDIKLVEAVRDAKQILSNRDVLASGTGFLVATGGYVLTSHHVIEGDGKIVIRVAGVSEPIAATLIGKDVQRDLALLKVALPGNAKLSPLGLAASQSRRGAAVAGFGYPLRDTLGAGLKFSAGVVSAVPDETNNRYLLDLTVNPGSSGGPLCDRRGNVVGMISEKTSSGGIESSYALAIPSGDLIKFLEQHLPVWSKRADAAAGETELEWDKVDERVSNGVVMVIKKK